MTRNDRISRNEALPECANATAVALASTMEGDGLDKEKGERRLGQGSHDVVNLGCVEGEDDATEDECDCSSRNVSDGDDTLSLSLSPNDSEDPLLLITRERSGGIALVAVLALSACIAANAVILPWQFQQKQQALHHEQYNEGGDARTSTVIPSYASLCSSSTAHSATQPLWQSVLEIEMLFLINLIHTALLAVTALVVACRGDVIWLYFVRNCTFFWFPVALLYFASDVYTNNGGGVLQLQSTAIFATLSLVVWVMYGATCRAIRNKKATEEYTHLLLASNTLHFATIFLQITALVYLRPLAANGSIF
jgi:hypothetical protein